MIHLGDCVTVMAGMEPDSVDAIVTDPPYGLPGGFMGKSWDRFAGHEDAGFAYWLAGLIDGEGHFAVKRHSRGTHAPYFQLKMRADEEGTLRVIQRQLRIGTITREEREPNPLVKWVVGDKAGCQRLVDLLDKYPLRAKKRLDYSIWREAVCEWTDRPRGNRWHGGTDNSRMESLRGRIMAVRKYIEPAWSGHEYQDWSRLWGMEAIRVLKPGGWLLAFGGTRAYHRMTAGLEDAGFEIRDTLQHIYASGFPKGKANLKPAHEPIVLARKPGPLQPLGIDAGRIPTNGEVIEPVYAGRKGGPDGLYGESGDYWSKVNAAGRWPSNVLLQDAELFDAPNPEVVGSGAIPHSQDPETRASDGKGVMFGALTPTNPGGGYGDTGGYSRFFIIPKADRADREPVLGGSRRRVDARMGLAHGGPGEIGKGGKEGYEYHPAPRVNIHPTTKPVDLMRHLVRLVTPIGGTVLDPFLGSGSTLIAATLEGFTWVGIEKEPEYVAIAEARLNGTQQGLGLDVAAPTRKRTWIPGANEDHKPRKGYVGQGQWGQWATETAKATHQCHLRPNCQVCGTAGDGP